MQGALDALVGPEAKGLSANVVGRLKQQWEVEYRNWSSRSLADEWVYIWEDGIYSGLRGDDGRLCCLVMIGVNRCGYGGCKVFCGAPGELAEGAQ